MLKREGTAAAVWYAGITAGGQPKLQVSGRVFTDAFGRATGHHDPFCENISMSLGSFNSHVSALIDTVQYDVLDRETETRQPAMNYITNKQYDVQNDAMGRRRFTVAVTDPNLHTTVQYSDYAGRQVQVTDAMGGITKAAYDALGQLILSADPEGFRTTYAYDKLGHMTRRSHPDAGITHYSYDAAGNMTHEVNPIGEIFYDYTYERLVRKRYSNIVENNVTYTYGTSGTGRGRPVRIQDGTGERTLEYDALGNVISETRTIAVPGIQYVYTFTTGYTYDSWGRMRAMTYPDGETVTYTYGHGGDLLSMCGDKGTEHHDYLLGITYNDYGQRSHILYGNGTSAEYGYDALHRLYQMQSVSASGLMQRIQYATNGVGNITHVGNTANAIGALGGQYGNVHRYDALNRLTWSAATDNAYTMTMEYSPAGRIATRRVASHGTCPMDIVAHYGYCRDRQPHAPRRIFDENADVLTDLVWDVAGNLGQVNTVRHDVYDGTRFLFWTEDSRMHHAVDGRYYSYYAYDHAGERTLKLAGTNSVVDVNAQLMQTVGELTRLTLYPSPYVVAHDHGYTKHYYVGSDRLCARIGGGGLSAVTQNDTLSGKAGRLFSRCVGQTGRMLPGGDIRCIRGLGWDDDVLHRDIREAPRSLKAEASICLNNFGSNMSYYSAQTVPEDYVYYYHGDHLGGANWITDANGVPVQHLQYLPFGERYIDQRAAGSTYHERYTFTGKERDEETGFGYFGARYMDHELMTMWLSVDPMADKYLSISPYAYCAWNPVKLVDPDGREIWIGSYNGKKSRYIPNKKGNTGVATALDMIYESKAGKFVINSLIKSKNRYCVSEAANPSGNENPGYIDANNQIYLNVKKHKLNVLSLSHELFHAFQDEKGVHGKLRSKEVEAFIFSGIVLSQLNNGRDVFSLNEAMPSGMDKAYTALESTSKKGKEYVLAMGSLTKGFSTAQMGIAVSRFLNFSMEGDGYRNERGYKYCGGDGVGYRPSTSLLNKYSKDLY